MAIEYKSIYTGDEIDESLSKARTAVQPEDLAKVASTGDYDDLINAPVRVTESTVLSWGFTKNTGNYSKPAEGIPKTDLDSNVQSSLDKADTAVQDVSMFITKDVDDLTNYYPKSETYTKSEVDGKVSSVYKYKGTVATYNDLPKSGQQVGDVYNIEQADPTHDIKAGDNVAWNGNEWDKIGGDIDLSGYQTKIDSSHKLDSSLVDDTNSNNKFTNANEKATWNAKYDKPSGGIPSTDLSSDVQTSLGKADTAIQDVSDKQDTLVSGVNIKTLNGESILGSGNLNVQSSQYDTIPTASVSNLGKIIQYTGATNQNYINGYFYKCIYDSNILGYKWQNIDVQPSGSVFECTETEWNQLTPAEKELYAIAIVDRNAQLSPTDISNLNEILGTSDTIVVDMTEDEAIEETNEIIGGV